MLLEFDFGKLKLKCAILVGHNVSDGTEEVRRLSLSLSQTLCLCETDAKVKGGLVRILSFLNRSCCRSTSTMVVVIVICTHSLANSKSEKGGHSDIAKESLLYYCIILYSSTKQGTLVILWPCGSLGP